MAEGTKTLGDLKGLKTLVTPVVAKGVVAAAEEPAAARKEPVKDAQGRSRATGKRKNAVARVWIKPGPGKITVNGRDSKSYFARPVLRMLINQPFACAGREGQFDVFCTVKGGGVDPVRAGIAPAVEGRRLPDPRLPRRRAQEVRQAQGPPQLPVLQAINFARSRFCFMIGRPLRGALFISAMRSHRP